MNRGEAFSSEPTLQPAPSKQPNSGGGARLGVASPDAGLKRNSSFVARDRRDDAASAASPAGTAKMVEDLKGVLLNADWTAVPFRTTTTDASAAKPGFIEPEQAEARPAVVIKKTSVFERWEKVTNERIVQAKNQLEKEVSQVSLAAQENERNAIAKFMDEFEAMMQDHTADIQKLHGFLAVDDIPKAVLDDAHKSIRARTTERKLFIDSLEKAFYTLEDSRIAASKRIVAAYITTISDLQYSSPYDSIIYFGDIVTKINGESLANKKSFTAFLLRMHDVDAKYTASLHGSFEKFVATWKSFQFTKVMEIIETEMGALTLTTDAEMIQGFHREQAEIVSEMNSLLLELNSVDIAEWTETWFRGQAKKVCACLTSMKASLKDLVDKFAVFGASREADLAVALKRWRGYLVDNEIYDPSDLDAAVQGLSVTATQKINSLPKHDDEFELFANSINRHHQCASLILNYFQVIMLLRLAQGANLKIINSEIDRLAKNSKSIHTATSRDLVELLERELLHLERIASQEDEAALLVDYNAAKDVLRRLEEAHREFESKTVGIVGMTSTHMMEVFDDYMEQLFFYLGISKEPAEAVSAAAQAAAPPPLPQKAQQDAPAKRDAAKDQSHHHHHHEVRQTAFYSAAGSQYFATMHSHLSSFLFHKVKDWSDHAEELDIQYDAIPQFALFSDPKIHDNALVHQFFAAIQVKLINDAEKWRLQSLSVANWKAESAIEKLKFECNTLIFDTDQRAKRLDRLYQTKLEELRDVLLSQDREASVIRAKADAAKATFTGEMDKLAVAASGMNNLYAQYVQKLIKCRTMEQIDALYKKAVAQISEQKHTHERSRVAVHANFEAEIETLKLSRAHHPAAWKNLDLDVTAEEKPVTDYEDCVDKINALTAAFRDEAGLYLTLQRAVMAYKLEFKKSVVTCDSLFEKLEALAANFEANYYRDTVTLANVDETFTESIKILQTLQAIAGLVTNFVINVPSGVLAAWQHIFFRGDAGRAGAAPTAPALVTEHIVKALQSRRQAIREQAVTSIQESLVKIIGNEKYIPDLPQTPEACGSYLDEQFALVEESAQQYVHSKTSEFHSAALRFKKSTETCTRMLIERAYENATSKIEGDWTSELKKYNKMVTMMRGERKTHLDKLKPHVVLVGNELAELDGVAMQRSSKTMTFIQETRGRIAGSLSSATRAFVDAIELVAYCASVATLDKAEGTVDSLVLEILDIEPRRVSYTSFSQSPAKHRDAVFNVYREYIMKKVANLELFFDQELAEERRWSADWAESVRKLRAMYSA